MQGPVMGSGPMEPQDQPTDDPEPPRPPLQFGLRAVLGIMAAVSLLMGTMSWLGVGPRAGALVLVILVVSVAAALALVVAIANAGS